MRSFPEKKSLLSRFCAVIRPRFHGLSREISAGTEGVGLRDEEERSGRRMEKKRGQGWGVRERLSSNVMLGKPRN